VIETRNRADQAVYAAERMLKDAADKLSSSDRAAVESAIEELKKASAGTDVTAINAAMEALNKAQHAAAESLYKTAQSSAGGGGAGPSPEGEASQPSGEKQGDVIDAEVVDEK
jgi:molecular chaperone DnaK